MNCGQVLIDWLRHWGDKMQFPQPLQEGRLIRRYKRFLADIETCDGTKTIHCPNTGSMKNCQQPGCRVWFTDSGNPKRKYPCTWQLVETSTGDSVGINTTLANSLVAEAIDAGVVSELADFGQMRTEVRYGRQNSRIDILLTKAYARAEDTCYVEIKNVSLGVENRVGLFPDAVTSRGQKHLQELMDIQRTGARAVLFFCVQHTGIDRVRPADEIDARYGRLLREAQIQGVELLAYRTRFDLSASAITLKDRIPIECI